MLPNQLGQTTFEEVQNSSVVELLNSSYSSSGNYHPELRKFVSTVIFPQCNVTVQNNTDCYSSSNVTNMISCMGNVTGTQLVPCRSWCEEVLNMAADWMKVLLPRCKLFPSSKHGCWNPTSAKLGNKVCYHGNGINYRGTWSKTTSGADCVEWLAEQSGYYKTEYPWANLDNNYCRNPTGLDRPFCLTDDGSQEDCDVIPCDADGCWDRGPPNYGKRSPSKSFYFVDERVTYTCNEGYTLKSGYTSEARCMLGGDWQYDKPSCSVNHRRRLQEELLEIYSASLAPENVVINFTGSVEQIVDLDEKKEQLVASVAIDFTWQDSRLSWDPKYYDDITSLNILGDSIWTPILTLKRNANPHSLQNDVPVRVSSNGQVAWNVETQTTTVCDADPFYFPADTMECHICLSAIAAVEQTIQCQGADKGNSPCNSYSDVTTEGEWRRNDQIFAKDNREACFVVHLKRIPLLHIATTVGPCIILVVLMTITFVMPLDRGDRISFGLTILLSMVVSLVFVTDVLPVKGALPFFATLIIVCMGLMGVFLLLTMAVIVIHDREGSLPPTVKVIFFRHISKILLLGDLTEKKRPCDEEADLTDFPATELEADLTDFSAIELINNAFQTHDKAEVSDERPCDGSETTRQPSTLLAGLVPTRSTALLELILNLKGVKNEVKDLAKAVDNKREVLKKVMMSEDEVSEYILLAKVLDRLCLVLYIISIAAAVPMTMYLGR
ncbi:5-hydroxytryptamine receptor 3A-like [Branchiostoma floridae]|uniref:5-hydroxytryptamine receptor 3A-like n=1 Tax=Branchiostoma floridae TaxID=7739 RepID=A0A9J7KIG8_BRAFL|nr:5-hydroxytryptamine receptor 3A-like [Branchiostoma floridae]